MTSIEASKYAHSPIHHAVATRDYNSLRKILSGLPQFCDPSEVRTESISLAEEQKAETISSVIDRRDVSNRDTPLHLAVKLSDETATAMLMAAGANKRLRNERGWNAIQEAIYKKKEGIARIIVKHSPVLAWARWCRTLPRLIGTMRRMRDFYMEITFLFESSVIPFISRVAPSDTFKFWKRGANLRADLTLDDFDGFRIQRADQSILFLGDGSKDGKLPPGSLWMVSHKDKQAIRDDDDAPASDEEAQRRVARMSQSNITRVRIDVTEAVLLPQVTWRRQEKAEMVGPWKAKVYDMHNLAASIESRKVSGAMTDDKLSFCSGNKAGSEELGDPLTEEEIRQLEVALKLDSSDLSKENGDEIINCRNGETKQEKKGWFGGRRKRENKRDGEKRVARPRSSLHVEDTKTSVNSESVSQLKKVLRPVIWLSPNFPFQTEELLPLLDIIASRVKAIRRWRELLATKFPAGTFPVKVAIPVVPTIRVLVTFTKFEELQPEDEFSTPGQEIPTTVHSSSSTWFNWIKAPYQTQSSSSTGGLSSRMENMQDPFAVPPDYKWFTAKEIRKKMQEKGNSKK